LIGIFDLASGEPSHLDLSVERVLTVERHGYQALARTAAVRSPGACTHRIRNGRVRAREPGGCKPACYESESARYGPEPAAAASQPERNGAGASSGSAEHQVEEATDPVRKR